MKIIAVLFGGVIISVTFGVINGNTITMSDNKRGRAVLLMYGEATTSLTVKVPESKKEEIRGKFYNVLKGYEKNEIRNVEIEQIVVEPKPKVIKEPTLITDKLYNTVSTKNIAGYGGLLKHEFSDKHYLKGDDGYFEFDDLQHITDYLIKHTYNGK